MITLTPSCFGGIYTTIIREGVHTECWNTAGKVKSFLLCTQYHSHFTAIHVHKARQALYAHCSTFRPVKDRC